MGIELGFPYGKTNVFEPEYSTEQLFPDHQTVAEASLSLGDHVWEKVIKFTVVRNPWDRVLSMYKYQLRALQIHPSLDFSSYVRSLYEVYTSQKSWAFLSYKKLWMSQYDFLSGLDGKIDQKINIILFERRELDLHSFLKQTGITLKTNLHLQSGHSLDYKNAYSDTDKSLVSEMYAKDIEYFCYGF